MLLFYILNVYSVYFLSQIVQMTPLISDKSHNIISLGTTVYGALYALLLSLALYQISRIPEQPLTSTNKKIYVAVSHVSAVIFALLGEVPFLHFSISPGFWHGLTFRGKITVVVTAIAILILCIYQLKRSWNRKQLCKEFYPWCAILFAWAAVWIALESQDVHYTLHVHHALFAGLFASWFWDLSSRFDVVMNAVFMGIVIEGIDFFGLSELHLFIIRYGSSVSLAGVLTTWAIVFVILCILTIQKQTTRHPTLMEVPLLHI